MPIIDVIVNDKKAILKNKDTRAVCGNSDYVIRFEFDKEWDEFNTKTARFVYGLRYTDVIFNGTDCPMPVIDNSLNVEIGVFAGNLHTTTRAFLPLDKSILCGNGSPEDPAPSVYTQIMEELDRKVNKDGDKVLSDNNYSNEDKQKVDNALQEHQDISGKVDKVEGKGLSTNDYTNTDKSKVDAIPENPKYTDTVYDDTAIKDRVLAIENKESTWDAKSDFSGDYNDLINKPNIPSKTSDLINDSGYLTEHQDISGKQDVITDLEAIRSGAAKGETSLQSVPKEYAKKTDIPTIPTKISSFENDSGYLTEHQDISGKVDKVEGKGLSTEDYTTEEKTKLNGINIDEIKSDLANKASTDYVDNAVASVPAGMPSFVDSVDEMTDTSKAYVLNSTGTIWAYKSATTEQEVTVTDQIEGVEENPYYENSRLPSSGTTVNSANGSLVSPFIYLDKPEYQGKEITIHLEGAKYLTEANTTYVQFQILDASKNILVQRGYSTVSVLSPHGITGVINSETSAVLTMTPPVLDGSNKQYSYIRFGANGSVANSNIFITYTDKQTVISEQWVDTGVQYGGSGLAEETLVKISELNNEGSDPSTIKLLSQPVLDFYNASEYPSDDYTTSHLSKITYPCRADIPIPFNVKWNHNENAMRTTLVVDTKAIGTVNAYRMKIYDVTGFDNYPIYNLLPNTRYYYKVTHVMADGSLVEAKSGNFLTSSESIRLLYIDGTQNVRDLGGWTGLNGKKVKYGKIIRGAALSDSSDMHFNVTGKGRQAFGDLKVKAELNLGATDTETSIASNCTYKKIYYTNYAIAITGADYRAQFKEVLEWIVDCLNNSKPIYIHCQGGCDRTGTLSFQLLGLLGVSESDLAKEYELSSFSDVGFGRLRTTTKAVDTYDYVGMVEALKTYSGDTITDKFYDFATTGCGISADTITSFRNLMLE